MNALSKSLGSLLLLALGLAAQRTPSGSDWPEWRGPARDGRSLEKNLPTRWSPSGENLAWKAPYGSRSGPIVLGDRLYLQNAAGARETLQERILCFNADAGKLLWEYKFNVYQSDVPPHRVGWAAPAGDPATGIVYAMNVGGHLIALSAEGKLVWERSLGEDFGLVTTHGGRTVSPVLDGDLVIVSGVTSGWGANARASHRFMAFDKKTGETVWINNPGGRPFDTTYSPPIVATVNGMRLFIAGGSDGAVHAMKPQTGEPVWKFDMSKRGINTGVVVNGATAYVSHSEENYDTNEMGLLAAIDASATGALGKQHVKWAIKGFQGSFSSPIIDGDRIIQVDSGANVFAFDLVTGKELWKQNLGTIQKASPVYADGKLYVGTENGKFFVLRPHTDRCEILHEVAFKDTIVDGQEVPTTILGAAAVSRGRVFFATNVELFAIGKKSAALPYQPEPKNTPPADAPAAFLQVRPTELLLTPGGKVRFHARLFDAKGRFLREADAAWTLEQLKGAIAGGEFTAVSDPVAQAGQVKATAGGLAGIATARVIPPLPWNETFDSGQLPRQWVNATGKFVVREVDGNKVLVKLADNPFTKRARVFMGPATWSNYTVQVDVVATEKRRQMGDGGVVAQRYALVLFGNHERLELQPWQPETA
ncbi:MAG: PQQ-binding-like beta-propeller repeat protein, partial [Acidobacteria bacterium]|nr:PQQ-binding-like beta-propeller repeat protein [Acidobacteriota bacterium]